MVAMSFVERQQPAIGPAATGQRQQGEVRVDRQCAPCSQPASAARSVTTALASGALARPEGMQRVERGAQAQQAAQQAGQGIAAARSSHFPAKLSFARVP